MKKLLAIMGICFLLVAMPVTIAISTPNETVSTSKTENIKTDTTAMEKSISNGGVLDDPPNWANGNFSGIWGFDIWGEVHIPIGWLFGYYKRYINFGYFYGTFDYFWGENESYLQGIIVGPFMFGSLGINESANETLFVGIGGHNETHYHWRIMGTEGPVFFMNGEYTKFE